MLNNIYNQFISLSEFTLQSAIIYEVNLFSMPRIKHVIYEIEYRVVKSLSCNQSLYTAYCHGYNKISD